MSLDDNDRVRSGAPYDPVADSAPYEDKAKATEPPPVVLRYVSDILRSESYSRKRQTFPTGLGHLDDKIAGGLKSRQQSILAAPTGTGKTGLAGTVMHSLAKLTIPILWVCTELDAEEQAARFAALIRRQLHGSGYAYTADQLLAHELPPEEQARLTDGVPIVIMRVRRRDPDPFGEIERHAAAMFERHGKMPIICIDYLQKLANGDSDSLRVSVADVSEQLLDLAQRLDTHMLAISSVGRAHYSATARKLRKQATDEDPRDWLACAKESGEIEYDAALLMVLDVGDDADSVTHTRPARLIVAKSRQGGEGFYGLRFHGPSGLFLPDEKAASEMKATAKQTEAVDLAKIKIEIRKRVMRRKKPFTSRTQIANLIDCRAADVFAALDEMFEDGELTQDGRGKPIAFTPPSDEE